VWIEGKIGDVALFSMTTKEEKNRRVKRQQQRPCLHGVGRVCQEAEGEVLFQGATNFWK
jgi:hypothetical protein